MKTTIHNLIILLVMMVASLSVAHAHPEDEFCQGVDGIDPALCAALAEIDAEVEVDFNPGVDPIIIERTWAETLSVYIPSGIWHIIPKGYDHILFVLGITLLCMSRRQIAWRQLLTQVLVFTIAHMTTMGVIYGTSFDPPANIVEPIIAFSILVIGVELFFYAHRNWRMPIWARLLMIFGFGLFHGAGYAGVFTDFQTEQNIVIESFYLSLISFNIGVEVGQLLVVFITIAIFFLLKLIWQYRPWIYTFEKKAISVLIALIGFWWMIERVLL